MTQDAGAQIQQLRQQAQALREQRARAEHQRSVAQATVTHAEAELAAEFGVPTVPEALQLLTVLGLQVQEQAAAVSAYLAQAGVSQ